MGNHDLVEKTKEVLIDLLHIITVNNGMFRPASTSARSTLATHSECRA